MTKNRYGAVIIAFMIFLVLIVLPRRGHAWSASAHAFIARNCQGAEQSYLQGYNARMGALVPDFFWYLRDTGMLDPAYADPLHGYDSTPASNPETPLYLAAVDELQPWNVGLASFAEGIKAHVSADIKVHNLFDGYLEGPGMWVDLLQQKTGSVDRLALHLALEFSIDALLIQKYGNQISDLLNTNRQGMFLDTVLTHLTGGLGFDVGVEFQRYVTLMRTLEKAAGVYGPYLNGGALSDELMKRANDKALRDAIRDLSDEELNDYLAAFQILRDYPGEIYETITNDMDWEDVIAEVIQECSARQ